MAQLRITNKTLLNSIVILTLILSKSNIASATATTKHPITIKTYDQTTNQLTPARIVIEHLGTNRGASKYFACDGKFLKFNLENLKEYFYTPGECGATLATGLYKIYAMRGMEYFQSIPYRVRVSSEGIFVAGEDEYKKEKDWRKAFKKLGPDGSISFVLERWINMKEKNFWSGDSHIHGRYTDDEKYFSDMELFEVMVAEDLNISNMVIANDKGSYVYDLEMFTGDVHELSNETYKMMWNQEMRNNHLGHMVAHNLNDLVGPLYSGFYDFPDNFSKIPFSELSQWDVPNADWADRAHNQHPNVMVEYAHPVINLGFDGHDDFPKDIFGLIPDLMELPIDVALNKIDGIEVFSYPGNNQDSILFWYRLLNTGHRLSAVAGTDAFVGSRTGPYAINTLFSHPPGGLRSYTLIPESEEFTYDSWVYYSKAGKTFVTNGPMIHNFRIVHINSGEERTLGEEFKLNSIDDKNQLFSVHFTVSSLYPINRWSIIVNGKRFFSRTVDLNKQTLTTENGTYYEFNISKNITIDKSSWVAIEILGDKQTWVFDKNIYAHTSPIYFTINDERQTSSEDAIYMVKRINRDMRYLAENGFFKPNTDQKEKILRIFEEGCHVYEAQQNETKCVSASEL